MSDSTEDCAGIPRGHQHHRLPAPDTAGCVPARGGVRPALHCGALLLPWGQGHGGGRVCLCDRHLFGLGGLLPTVGTVAGIIDSRGTVLVKAVGDAALGLTFHETTLKWEDESVRFGNGGAKAQGSATGLPAPGQASREQPAPACAQPSPRTPTHTPVSDSSHSGPRLS